MQLNCGEFAKMQLSEHTIKIIRTISDQIEGLTCALVVYIENVGAEIEQYKYQPFNNFFNEVRTRHIEAIKDIKRMFEVPEDTIYNMVDTVRASENSLLNIKSEMNESN